MLTLGVSLANKSERTTGLFFSDAEHFLISVSTSCIVFSACVNASLRQYQLTSLAKLKFVVIVWPVIFIRSMRMVRRLQAER